MKSWLTGLVVVALLGGGAWYWLGRGGDPNAVPMFRTAKVGRAEIVQSVTATGQLSPLTTVEVGTQVSGRIAKLYVDFNDPVKTGQLLAEIEPDSYTARMVQAQAQLDSARANYELKKVTADRSAELRKNNLVAQSDYDQAMAELRQQEASVRIAEASLQNAKLDVDRCKIYSPIDGVVISRDIDVGQTVQSSFSAPKLFSIAQDLRQMEISAAVSEADIGGVEPGQEVSFIVDAFPDRNFAGSVRQVRANATVTSNVVTYPTIISVDNEDLKLLPGMTAAPVEIVTGRRANVLQVPNAALRYRPPENVTVIAAAVEAGSADGGDAAAAGLTIDQVPELAQVPSEFRQRMFDRHDADKNGRLSPAEIEELKKAQEAFRARMAGGGGGGFGGGRGPGGGGNGGGRSTRPAPDVIRTVYVVASPPPEGMPATGDLIEKTVKIGITDGANTEIISGLAEGDIVVVGTADPSTVQAASPTNPFMPQFGRRRR